MCVEYNVYQVLIVPCVVLRFVMPCAILGLVTTVRRRSMDGSLSCSAPDDVLGAQSMSLVGVAPQKVSTIVSIEE